MRRDRATVGLVVMLPLIQLFLFGYAINANPRHLPTGLITAEHSTYERTLVAALQNTGYFDIQPFASGAQADQALARGDVLFVLNIPPDFSRRHRSRRAASGADGCRRHRSDRDRQCDGRGGGAERHRAEPRPAGQHADDPAQPPFQMVLHARYNPEQITALNIVPGLIGADPDGVDTGDDDAGDHARARGGHDGEPAGDAGASGRGDAGQDHPLCRSGLCADRADPAGVGTGVPGADARLPGGCCCSRSACSSPAIWRWGLHSPPWRRPRCRRSNWRSSGCCRR